MKKMLFYSLSIFYVIHVNIMWNYRSNFYYFSMYLRDIIYLEEYYVRTYHREIDVFMTNKINISGIQFR